MIKKSLQLCTAGAPTGEPDVIKVIREVQVGLAGLKDILEEPLKSQLTAAENAIQLALAKAPEDKQSKDNLEVLKPLADATKLALDSLTETAKTAKTELAATRASMPEEIKKAIEAQIASGDLVPKAAHEKAITDATAAATSAAHEAAKAEITLLNSRRQILATASLPVPEDKLLTGDDKAFEAKKTAAAKRLEDLKPYKFLPAERVLSLCWLETDEAFTGTLALIKTATEAATASVKSGANPFINRPAADNQPSRKPVTGVC